jgi:hypothetical protein
MLPLLQHWGGGGRTSIAPSYFSADFAHCAMISREEVYKAIDGERDYQDARWPGHIHNESEYILYLRHYVDEAAKKASTLDLSDVENMMKVLSDIRKIAALAVVCMEQNGVVHRV